MRWPLTYLTLPFLAVHCSAPPHSATFEGDGGATSAEVTSATSTASSGGGSGPATATGTGSGASLTANTSSSTSQGGMGGSAGAPPGTDAGGNGAGGDSTTAATGGSATTSSVGGNGGDGATGGSGTTAGTGGTGASGGTGGASCTPTEEVCDGADNDCNESVDEEDVCPDGCFGASFEARSYLFCDRPPVTGGNSEPARSWQQALQYCQNRDLNLALIESEEENSFIYKTLLRLELGGDAWMGATDQDDEGLWTWAVSDEPDAWIPFYDQFEEEPIDGAFSDWREGEPNDDGGEDCGIFEDLGSDEWAWDDRDCQTQFDLFVCESPD